MFELIRTGSNWNFPHILPAADQLFKFPFPFYQNSKFLVCFFQTGGCGWSLHSWTFSLENLVNLKKKKEKRQRSSNRVFSLRHVVKKPCFFIVDLLLSGTAAPKICLQPEGKDRFSFLWNTSYHWLPNVAFGYTMITRVPCLSQTIVAHLSLLLEEKLCKYRNEYIFSFTVRRKNSLVLRWSCFF